MKKFNQILLLVGVLAAPVYGAQAVWISKPGEGRFFDGDSRYASFDESGRYVIFQSKAQLLEFDTNNQWDIYLWDRKNDSLKRISEFVDNRANGGPKISLDGRWIAYHSYPEYVVMGRKPRACDIYLADRKKGVTVKITRGVEKEENGESLYPSLDEDGRVVFSSNDIGLLKGKKHAIRTIYYYNPRRRSLNRIPINGEEIPNRNSVEPVISNRGNYVLFKSAATNLDPPLPEDSLAYHLYLHDVRKKKTHRIDMDQDGFDADTIFVGQSVMTKNAQEIIFEGAVKNPVEPSETLVLSNLYAYNRKSGTIQNLTEGRFPNYASHPRVSLNGRYLIFLFSGFSLDDRGGLVVWDRKKDKSIKMLDDSIESPEISPNGRWISFESTDPKWGATLNMTNRQVYMIENPFFSR